MRALPQLITAFRLLCSPIVAYLILESRFRSALELVFLAGVSDWFDGYAARRLRVAGQLGAIFDPLADKILLTTLFVVLAIARLIPLWMFALVIGRDLVIVIGALLVRLLRNITRFTPSVLGKVSTFFQIVLVLLAIAEAAFPNLILLWLKYTALALTALFTFLSGVGYVRRGIQMARRQFSG